MEVRIKNMENEIPTILFVCEHGSAKSTIAAEHFNKLAGERNLPVQAISRGTDPDSIFPDNVVAGLQSDGLKIGEPRPQKLSQNEIDKSIRIITFCELPDQYENDHGEDWSDVPPVSENYERSRDQIVERVKRILDEVHSSEREEN